MSLIRWGSSSIKNSYAAIWSIDESMLILFIQLNAIANTKQRSEGYGMPMHIPENY